MILVSFFSGENTPSTDTSHYLQLLPEVCRSVIFGPPCIVVIVSLKSDVNLKEINKLATNKKQKQNMNDSIC